MQSIFAKLDRYFCRWRLAVLDETAGRWIVKPSIAYLKAENAHGRHILMQPARQPYYLLADDITADMIRNQHQRSDGSWRPARMVIETSPDNYQVWIHSSRRLCLDEKRYWLKTLHSDPGADPNNRWGRCPGFRNRKRKHRRPDGGYPLARLIWIDWKNRADIPPVPAVTRNPPDHSSAQPYRIHAKICRSDYTRSDPSATDFAYVLALLRRGYSDRIIRQRIIAERTDWRNHRGQNRMDKYLNRTLDRARNIIGRT